MRGAKLRRSPLLRALLALAVLGLSSPVAETAALARTKSISRQAQRPTPASLVVTPPQLVGKSLFDVSLGAEVYGRRFEYRNGIAGTPSVHRGFEALAAGVSGRLFPFAASGGLLGDIGLAAGYSSALLRTTPHLYSFALCARMRLRSDARALLGAAVGYAVTSFPSEGPVTAELPAVTYRSLRPAVDARMTFGALSVVAATAMRIVLDANAISSRFYNPRGFGFDAELGAAFMFVRRFEWRVLATYERYLFAFTPRSGATFAAGGALDERYGVRGSLAFVF